MITLILILTGIAILVAIKANAEIERAKVEAEQYRARQDLEIRQREVNRWAPLNQGAYRPGGKRFKQRGK